MTTPQRRKRVTAKGKEPKGTEIVRWHPDDYMFEVNRMLRDFESRFSQAFPPIGDFWTMPRYHLPGFPEIKRPHVDLIDSGNEYRVVAEVPGIPKEKLDITITPREISIKGEAKTDIEEEREGFVHRERRYATIQRSLSFPEEVIPEEAQANVNNGLLEVKVKKKTPTEVKSHKVQVT